MKLTVEQATILQERGAFLVYGLDDVEGAAIRATILGLIRVEVEPFDDQTLKGVVFVWPTGV